MALYEIVVQNRLLQPRGRKGRTLVLLRGGR